jgi:hypothetical protein
VDNLKITKRIDGLNEKLKDGSGEMIKIDYNSFSEAERLLFAKVDEIEAEYRQTGSEEILAKNQNLIDKNIEIIHRRVEELYCYMAPLALGCDGTHEIVEYFFNLHFYNFQADLLECLSHFRKTWDKKDREEFLLDLKKNGAQYYRIPRGFNQYNCKKLSKFVP